jgi:hypothetical protein
MARTCSTAAVFGLLAACAPFAAQAQARRYVEPKMASDTTTLPYSEGVLVGSRGPT